MTAVSPLENFFLVRAQRGQAEELVQGLRRRKDVASVFLELPDAPPAAVTPAIGWVAALADPLNMVSLAQTFPSSQRLGVVEEGWSVE